jgi:parallel beta-helix repeat protein
MRHGIPLASLSLVAWLVAAAPAAAQNAATAGTLELVPTLQSIGVRLGFTGDLNGNASAHLEWRPSGSATWKVGVSMDRITNSRFAGSVLWLSPATSYDVRAVIDDPDGGATASGTVTTRANPIATPTGGTWWVAVNGNDANNGSSGAPLATLAAAAGKASPGDQIRVRAGVYYQTLSTGRAGTASAPIHLVADGPGVILDGSDPAYLNRSDWQNEGGGVYSVPYTGTTMLVSADSTQRLYHQADVPSLTAGANSIAQGYTIATGRLYVRLEDGSNPAGHTIHVARYNQCINVGNSYWRVAGFEVRNAGTSTSGGGIVLINADGCSVSDNTVHTYGGKAGIYLRSGVTNAVVERNEVYDPRISTWPWASVKAHDEEIIGILNRGQKGNVIRNNHVHGGFDGIDDNAGTTDENQGSECDISDNTMDHLGDDAVESDDISAINLRLLHNTIDHVFSGVSVAPNTQGPEYILYNTITNTGRGGFKFSLSGTGQTWICHNTLSSDAAGIPAVHPSGPYSNMHFRNNVLTGDGIAAVDDDAGESATGNDFDGDLVWANVSAFFRWKGVNYSSLATLQSATGFETRGRNGNPMFVNAAAGDYRLQPGSPAIDGGIVLPGINDGYLGAAPDMGAFETSAGPDVTRPAPITDLR